ncbi:MAG: 6-bladed beta-propeller [Dysgonamonadaceae bacterium]|jgi:hypothetical protein|nr:6-bladed beta-propeller [Dysgonamonadaceae bacterium]
MKNTIYTIVLLFICLLVSCSPDRKQNKYELTELYVNLYDKNIDFYELSDEVQEFEFIRLETTDNCLIGHIEKILLENDVYYILDNIYQAIYCFSSSGKHIATLNRFGPGPDEYLEINDFVVENENIWICDNRTQRVVCYDKNQNRIDWIDLKKNDFWVEHMVYQDGYIYMVNNWIGIKPKNYQILIYDLKNKKTSLEKPFSPLQHVIYRGMNNQIALIDSLCMVTFSYCDTIFQIRNETIVPKYKYRFSERMIDVPLVISDNPPIEDPNIIKGLMNIYQTPNSIILKFSDNGKIRMAIFDKENTSGKIYSGFKIADLGNFHLIDLHFLPNSLISIFDSVDFKMYFAYLIDENFKRQHDKEKIKEEVSKIKDDDNPLLFRFILKNNSKL